MIFQHFNRDFLSNPLPCTLKYLKSDVEIIIEKAKRQIRSQDTRKRKEFEKLLKEFEGLHGRKTIEKEEYNSGKKNRKEMFNSGSTCCFKRPKKL